MLYSKEELYSYGNSRSFPAEASEVAFPLGGIGTGNVSLGARGEFRDWEIFNAPGKGNTLPYSFFAVWAQMEGYASVCKVLQAELRPPYSGAQGVRPFELAGLPHLESSVLQGEYPFAAIDFKDSSIPVKLNLEAFTPLIPLNSDDSGIPAAVIRYQALNMGNKPVKMVICGSLINAVGFGRDVLFRNVNGLRTANNEYINNKKIHGLFFTNPGLAEDNLSWGSMAIMTTADNITVKPQWLQGDWSDGIWDFWDDFSEDGLLEFESQFDALGSVLPFPIPKVGSLGIINTLKPGEKKRFEFILSWYFPNRPKGWGVSLYRPNQCCDGVQKNYYSTLFNDAWDSGAYLIRNLPRLEKQTHDFHDALFSSSYPEYVIDALASNIAVIRSPTCFRGSDGTLFSFEGCNDKAGSCEGNCTHVWNYAQTMAFLFPDLERSMRRVEFQCETDRDGNMAYRAMRVFDEEPYDHLPPAADGQLGTIIKLYRDWKLSGDSELLRDVWPKASLALDFAFKHWDSDGDCVLDDQQHTTYDIEFYGPNSLTNSVFFAALEAGARMAEFLGNKDQAATYRDAVNKGSDRMDQLLWNGEYYQQLIEDVNQYRYQYGTGCLSDQVFGQLLAHVAGLGYILPEEHVRSAIQSVFNYNFRDDFKDHVNVWRTYALNDEKGLLLCTWPKGGRPRLPFMYCNEVWTGIEYQVAAHLIYENFIDEGLTITKAVRDRYDGYRRNPWDEVECGHHYVRSMASWSLLLALSGFKYDLIEGRVEFDPVINKEDFRTFWSTGKGWGTYTQKRDHRTGKIEKKIEVLYGTAD